MVKLLKHGMDEKPKTKSIDKHAILIVLFGFWFFSLSACSRSFNSAGSMPATDSVLQPATTATSSAAIQQHPDNQSPDVPKSTQTATALSESSPDSTTPTLDTTQSPPVLYYTQAGDTLPAVAVRFNVLAEEITSPDPILEESLFVPDQLLIIPDRLDETTSSDTLISDSEVVFSPSAIDFDVELFVQEASGYLSTYRQYLDTGWHTGSEVIARVAIENSINPRLLLSMLEFQSHWVYGQPSNLAETDYPMGWRDFHYRGLYRQLSWAVQHLSIGYYGWRAGIFTELEFPDQEIIRLAPDLNAGSVALQNLFSKLYNQSQWGGVLYSPEGLPELHEQMFGNPWTRAQTVEPLYPPNLKQPTLVLPFQSGYTWSLTGGPHSAWGPDGALAALDFAPASAESGCVKSQKWVTASAPGLVVRSGNGVVMVDLDGDGHEQTGWALLYMHIANEGRVKQGTWIDTDDRIGHPSCLGGLATGTHLHFVRKYNGEWILADGPMPFVLSGWRAHAGEKPYKGTLTKGDLTVIASTRGSFETNIERQETTP